MGVEARYTQEVQCLNARPRRRSQQNTSARRSFHTVTKQATSIQ